MIQHLSLLERLIAYISECLVSQYLKRAMCYTLDQVHRITQQTISGLLINAEDTETDDMEVDPTRLGNE